MIKRILNVIIFLLCFPLLFPAIFIGIPIGAIITLWFYIVKGEDKEGLGFYALEWVIDLPYKIVKKL